MKLLLDTHALLWWLDDDPRLGRSARFYIANEANEILVSIASLWEVAIKHRVGKLRVNVTQVVDRITQDKFAIIALNANHLVGVEKFKNAPHNDPFDHVLLAQAAFEEAKLMTNDKWMRRYSVPCISTD